MKQQSWFTKDELKDALKNHPTKQDIKDEMGNYVTKDVFGEFKDELFNKLDNIVGLFETIRDEQTLAYDQHKGLEEKVEDHEKRLTHLETPHS